MPAIRVIDRESRTPRRRAKLWETFGFVGVNPTELKEGKGVFYAIVRQEQIESVINDEVKSTFLNNGFEITTPIEYDSLRSVIINHLDKVITEYSDAEVIESINCSNDWAEVLEIIRITTTGRLLKIKFKSTAMAQRAINEGIIILYQKINPKHVEKEVFVRITPCYNCYQYTHKTRECPQERKTLCSFCATEGHKHNECTNTEPKCINCSGKHRTLASSCKIRRDIIKEKTKEIRARSRSRSQGRVTYAQRMTGTATSSTTTQSQSHINIESNNETKQLITKIITSVAFSHYMEALNPGSFQRNMDEMFKLNGLPQMQFPKNIVTENILEIYKDSLKENRKEGVVVQTEVETPQEGTTQVINEELMETETQKRSRESNDSTEAMEKRKKDEHVQKETIKQTTDYTLPPPISAHPRPVSPAPIPGPSGGESTTGARERTKVRESSQREQRDSSLSKSKINVREIGIVVYLRKSSRYIIDLHNQERREILRDAIIRGESKIQWRHPQATYEAIYNGIVKRFIKVEDISITKLPEKDFEKMKTKCIQPQT